MQVKLHTGVAVLSAGHPVSPAKWSHCACLRKVSWLQVLVKTAQATKKKKSRICTYCHFYFFCFILFSLLAYPGEESIWCFALLNGIDHNFCDMDGSWNTWVQVSFLSYSVQWPTPNSAYFSKFKILLLCPVANPTVTGWVTTILSNSWLFHWLYRPLTSRKAKHPSSMDLQKLKYLKKNDILVYWPLAELVLKTRV